MSDEENNNTPGASTEEEMLQDPSQLEGDDALVAQELGVERYVLGGFFAATIAAGYVLTRTLEAIWVQLVEKDWFMRSVPPLAALSEDKRAVASAIFAGIASLVAMVRLYRRTDVHAWAFDVAGELAKVKWPTKKEVSNSTMVVIAASAIAVVYLALLDKLWAFITNRVYGI